MTPHDSQLRLVWPAPLSAPPLPVTRRLRRPAQPDYVRRHAPELFLVPVPSARPSPGTDESQANASPTSEVQKNSDEEGSIVRKADTGKVRFNRATTPSMTSYRQQFTRNGRTRPDISDRSFHLTWLTTSLRQPPPPKLAFLRPADPPTPPQARTTAVQPSETTSELATARSRPSETKPGTGAPLPTSFFKSLLELAQGYGRALSASLPKILARARSLKLDKIRAWFR